MDISDICLGNFDDEAEVWVKGTHTPHEQMPPKSG